MATDPPPKVVLLFPGGLEGILASEALRRAGADGVLLRHQSVFFPLGEGAGPGHVRRRPVGRPAGCAA